MFAAIVDGELVGRAGIRFELNEMLAFRYGNVGYGVVEEHRRKGYATEILRQFLLILADEGISPALVTCWDHNIDSGKVIENNGGQLESIVPDKDGIPFRRYWVTI
jgi:predicted acetyltransferase